MRLLAGISLCCGLFLVAVGLNACKGERIQENPIASHPESSESFPKVVVDSFGHSITFDKPAKTHIFLSFCEEIAMLKNWDNAVALSQAVYHQPLLKMSNPSLDSIPKASGGNGSKISIEQLKHLNPDVVFVWAGDKSSIEFALSHGIKMVALYPQNIDEVLASLELIASVFDEQDLISQKLQSTRAVLEMITHRGKLIDSKKRVIYLWDKPTRIAGSIGMVGDMLERIGVENLGSTLALDSYEISLEKIVMLNPEVILIWGGARFSAKDILENPQFQHLSAVQNNKVYKMPLWDNWGPRVVQTALYASILSYPEIYDDVDFVAKITHLNNDLFELDLPIESEVLSTLDSIRTNLKSQ